MFAVCALELGRLALCVVEAFLSLKFIWLVCGGGEAHFQWTSDHLFLIIQIVAKL